MSDIITSGTPLRVRESNNNIYGFEVSTTGTPTAVTVSIIGALYGSSNYGILATHAFTADEITAGFAQFDINGKTRDYIDYTVDVLTGGITPTVEVRVKAG